MVIMATIVCILILSGVLLSVNGIVIELNNDNFDQYVNGDKHCFVEFYAPWCGHCKRLAPAYEEVGMAFDNHDSVLIAKVDADSERDLGGRFGVRGFPTLKFFPKGSTEAEDYNGGRTADDIIKFINEKANTRGQIKKAISAVVDLDPSNFKDVVRDPTKNVLVEFYAPWCGHCKALAPIYEEVATSFKAEEDCVVAKVDADSHKDLAIPYGVSGFPTIKFFSKDNKKGESYDAGRNLEELVQYLNNKCGASRLPGGKLNENAGVVESMHDYVERFMTESDQREEILSEAEAAMESEQDSGSSASYYVKVMKKILDKGNEYIQKEYERLGRILDGDISLKKNDELTIKRNVLRKFEL